ncbi:hypothetical protein JQX09_17780 [Sulfitobacter pseudonitzschiae]|uniref:Uncharacterized protein n=1 Tax=Pseudosulfitobacter pseudonitzschiae TaxID=1402135 RepID=A0A9Q2S1N9_9RHOB|nr:hypothetical protein [Pseudosulfitobacter pseudonitzschiae]MBM2293781.1 hypothetical protein [Pseudosulfitobacter pseudonitzschiae]MBM2298699.1 hypothetical protein [Pseudosulfitobacter pseudonitzschiae]MBM2303613.1 hypothetical protein [Pseudosulfitobacter pseudonitzschiae]MBM2313396.1 hypothetical protein [Pseudosulfitobacter pseudonitzschiae]MBM2318309.1 hypothetical protein [Pseudosulfitobacter pseudonitzschiae]
MTQILNGIMSVKTQYSTSSRHVRFKKPDTDEYLHLSGTGVTKGTTYAWIGTKAQARTLRDRAKSNGQDWPFKAVSPEELST